MVMRQYEVNQVYVKTDREILGLVGNKLYFAGNTVVTCIKGYNAAVSGNNGTINISSDQDFMMDLFKIDQRTWENVTTVVIDSFPGHVDVKKNHDPTDKDIDAMLIASTRDSKFIKLEQDQGILTITASPEVMASESWLTLHVPSQIKLHFKNLKGGTVVAAMDSEIIIEDEIERPVPSKLPVYAIIGTTKLALTIDSGVVEVDQVKEVTFASAGSANLKIWEGRTDSLDVQVGGKAKLVHLGSVAAAKGNASGNSEVRIIGINKDNSHIQIADKAKLMFG